MSLLDTHTYDGKLKIPNVPAMAIINFALLRQFARQLRIQYKNPTASRAVELIINDLSHNYDPTNGLDALKLLMILVQSIPSEPYFHEQLSDIITNGPCPQGRCTRLYQVYLASGLIRG